MNNSFIALGSNLDSPRRQVTKAVKRVKNLPQTYFIDVAPFYKNPAIGLKNQPKFINTVVQVKTRLSPFKLLFFCQAIEKKQGRVRKRKWGARKIDIDIIFLGKRKIDHPRLCLPHPHYKKRDFVYIPLSYLSKKKINRYNSENLS